MSVSNMKEDIAVITLDAPAPSMPPRTWKDIADATTLLGPKIASDVLNLVAPSPIQGRITCSSTSVESMDDLSISSNANPGLDCDLLKILKYQNIEATWRSVAKRLYKVSSTLPESAILPFRSSMQSSFAPRSTCPVSVFTIDNIQQYEETYACNPSNIANIWIDHGAPLHGGEVNPNFRTPPSFCHSCLAPSIPGFLDEVIPTFRGHPTVRPNVPTRLKPHVHRCGIG